MRRALFPLVSLLLLGTLLPARAQQASAKLAEKRGGASGMTLQTGEACSGISREECCAQMLQLAGLKAQGDYFPPRIQTTVELTCQNEAHVVTPQVCKSISLSRGFSLTQAESICKPAARECHKDGACRKCDADLARLNYQGSYHACRAVTYMPDRSRAGVVVIGPGADQASDTRFVITRRKQVR